MRKTRYWVCKKCKIVYKRKKKEGRIRNCIYCRNRMTASCKIPHNIFEQRKRLEKTALDKEMKLSRHWRVPRDSHGNVLRISRECRIAWHNVIRAKWGKTFVKRADIWLKELYNCIHRKGVSGIVGTPQIEIADLPSSLYGEYTRKFLEGVWRIRINKSNNVEQRNKTLIHEALHYIDDQSKLPNQFHNHSFEWNERLERLTKDMSVKPRRIK